MLFYLHLLPFLELNYLIRKFALGLIMDTYHLKLSWSELDSLKASLNKSIQELEKCHDMINQKLDEPLTPELYAQYLEYLSNVSRDRINMLSILCKAGLSHE